MSAESGAHSSPVTPPGEGGVEGAQPRLPKPFGKFVLKRRLARGGMAEVFLAGLSGAQGFEKELVVKLIRPELAADEAFVRRFVEEAKTCVRLTHPNIVSIFELGVETGVLYLAMELVRGATLAEILGEGGALHWDEGAYVALELARALDHAHRRQVVHRDVTPGNVMIDEEGGVKLLDFGIAAPAGLDSIEVFGTPGHMPLEQLEGKPLSGSTDLFALGTVLVEAWTGRPPYRRADARASRTALMEGPPPPLSTSLPDLAPLDELVTSLLARVPTERPQHADDVARVLRRVLRERNIDLDEVARALGGRVRRAMAAREEREAGRAVAAPPMPKAMRPTPLGDATKTFATRGEIGSWSGTAAVPSDPGRASQDGAKRTSDSPMSTRKVDEAASQPAGTRRIESTRPAAPLVVDEAPPPPPRSPLRLVAALVALAAIAGGGYFALRPKIEPSPPPPPASATTTTGGPTASSTSSTSSTGSATTTGGSATATTSTSASGSAVPTTSTSATTSGSAVVGTARLVVTSSPPATCELDGRPLGRTPINTTATFGDHRLVMRPAGLGESFERRVTVSATSGVDVHGDFNDEPTISIHHIPPK